MPTLIDSHVHLDGAAFEDDLTSVIARATQAGIERMIVPATDFTSWARIRSLCAGYPCLAPAYGLHPAFQARHVPEHVESLSSWLDEGGAMAVGEIGLDLQRDAPDLSLQRWYFQRQLQIAREHDLPVIVHARGAIEEVILTLRRTPGLRGVVHSFSGSEQQAGQLWRMGFMLGFGGAVTYDRALRLHRVVTQIPLDQLLLESDAPDQPDAHHRGQRNEPGFLHDVLRSIASLRSASEDDIALATTANARRLFGLAPMPA